VAYSIPSPQNSAIILLSSLTDGLSYLLAFVTDFPMTISFEMGFLDFFLYGRAKITCLHSLKYSCFQVPLPRGECG